MFGRLVRDELEGDSRDLIEVLSPHLLPKAEGRKSTLSIRIADVLAKI
jgi:hypothetical protein